MKLTTQIKASEQTGQTRLRIQYISAYDIATSRAPGVRTATFTRPTLMEAVLALLDKICIEDVDGDELVEEGLDAEEIIEEICYYNGESSDSDVILEFKNETTGEVYIDENYPEENY